MGVATRFNNLLQNITLTAAQQYEGSAHRESVCEVLNYKYYLSSSGASNSFYIGSWGKGTAIRPPRDVDVLFILPNSEYVRFNQRLGNKQSQLLQEIKVALLARFPRTDVRGDGPVVVVPFQSYAVELLPAFHLQNGQYWIPITSNQGYYKVADPNSEIASVRASDHSSNGNARHLIKMMKKWQEFCSVPIKSFAIELLAINFLERWPHRGKTSVYYDYMARDFFYYLLKNSNSSVTVPGTYEVLYLGDQWASRAQSAYDRAVKACVFEYQALPYAAGGEWQKIFGTDIPLSDN